MASLTLLLRLLLMVSAASAWTYSRFRYHGGSLTFTPKGRNPDGTYKVDLHNKQSTAHCHMNYYSCSSGHCGSKTQTTNTIVARNSYGFTWCQYDVVNKLKLYDNLPFEIRYPTDRNSYYGQGFWTYNVRSSLASWRMMAHVDLGTRSDTGESNRSPIMTMLPVLRVTRNCPRSFNMTVFDPEGDRVRCRIATSSSKYECGLCGLPRGFSLDQNSCSLQYTYNNQHGSLPVELVVEDFPKKPITLYYSDGSYTAKLPLSVERRKRDTPFITTSAFTTTTTAAQTIAEPTIDESTTAASTTAATTTAAPTTAAPTTAATTTAASTTAATTTAETTTAETTTAASTIAATTIAASTIAATTTAATTTAATTTTASTTAATTTAETTTAATTTAETTTAETTTAASTIAATTTAASTTAAPTTAATTTAATNTTATTTAATNTTAPTTAAPTTAAPTTTTTASTTAATTTAETTTAAPTTTTTATTTAPYRTSIGPLSKLPLQFTVFVDTHYAPSCLDGDYFPIYVSPTPRNGVNLPAFVNQTLEIKVRSRAQYTTIIDLIVTGPNGISKQKISTEEYIIKWTPTENELDDHFPICFVSEARDQRYGRVYQSELRCVIVDVGHHESTVTCNETTITVEVEKTYLIRRNEENLHLNNFRDALCSLKTRSNTTHLVAVMSLNTCGTLVEEDEDNIIFKNQITSADPNEIISRQHDVEIAFSCVYPKRTNLTLGFTHKNPYAFIEKGFGAFTFQFEFFESQRFRKQVDASTFPVEVYLKQMMFMQIEATTSIPNTELFVESCRATPYDNPNSRISYTIIEHGCVRDDTVQIYPSSKSQFRFGMEAFEFIGAHEEVYITCSVILCETGVPGTRCSQGCINSGSHRGKREAVAQSSSHSISQGPLHLVKTSDSKVSVPSLNLGVNVMLFASCLLACGVMVYHLRRSRAKYQLLPTMETD